MGNPMFNSDSIAVFSSFLFIVIILIMVISLLWPGRHWADAAASCCHQRPQGMCCCAPPPGSRSSRSPSKPMNLCVCLVVSPSLTICNLFSPSLCFFFFPFSFFLFFLFYFLFFFLSFLFPFFFWGRGGVWLVGWSHRPTAVVKLRLLLLLLLF
jgi:hypothetical protein